MKKFTANGFINKKMNDSVYSQRRIVIDLIYKAKFLLRSTGIEMPRVDVRITTREIGETALGKATMGGKIIWIPEDCLNADYLYQVVLHELCHALWGIDHDKKCKLMHPNVQLGLSNADAEKLFIAYAKKHNKFCNILL